MSFVDRLKSKIIRGSFNIKKKFFVLKMKFTKNNRPSSHPFISSDSFRAISDHVYDEIRCDSPIYDVRGGDTVFVSSKYIYEYFKYIHKNIKHPYILIMHDGTIPVDNKVVDFINTKIIHWFAKNVLVEHPKITPIPIGLENLCNYGTGIIGAYNRLRKKDIKKKDKILYHFKIATNPKDRQIAYDYISKHPLSETFPNKLHPSIYQEKLMGYKFVISPPGAGRECHRTWEAIYLGTIPIVKKSVATNYFATIGAPLWVVEDWSELDNITEEQLSNKYREIMSKSNSNVIWMDYWINKINDKKSG